MRWDVAIEAGLGGIDIRRRSDCWVARCANIMIEWNVLLSLP
jgi:hypothetical protein